MEHWRLHHPMHWQRDIETTFFKCTRWQLEETLDPGICPYHYYCYSTYHGDYPSFIDILVFAFVAASFFSTVVLSLMEILPGRRQSELECRRRYLLPSGPISLPVMLLILAKGRRINTLFPIISTGPAILQLIRVSALAFESETDSDIRRVHVLYLQKEDLGSGWNSDPLPGIVSHHDSGCLYFVLKNFLQIGTAT
ncbi:hypothetical protein Droror1_Dr00027457 [Drosera rotundifolia]